MGPDPARRATPRARRRALERRAPAPRADPERDPQEPDRAGRDARQPRAQRERPQRLADQRLQEPGARSAAGGAAGAQLREVLEQFALLDRTNTYNAEHAERDPRLPRRDRPPPAHALASARQRRAVARGTAVAAGTIRSSIAAEKQRYRGLRAEVRRLIVARRQAEIAASRNAAAKAQALTARRERARRGQRHRRREHGRRAARRRCRPRPRAPPAQWPSRSASWARRTSPAAPPQRVRLLRPRLLGLRAGGSSGAAPLLGRSLERRHEDRSTSRARARRPRLLQQPRPRRDVHRRRRVRRGAALGDVVKISNLADGSDYLGAVRIAG